MKEHGVKLGLLDYISFKTGCTFLSDLHDRRNLPYVQSAVLRLKPSLFGLEEWNDAARYITGEDVDFKTREEAARFILSEGVGLSKSLSTPTIEQQRQ